MVQFLKFVQFIYSINKWTSQVKLSTRVHVEVKSSVNISNSQNL